MWVTFNYFIKEGYQLNMPQLALYKVKKTKANAFKSCISHESY